MDLANSLRCPVTHELMSMPVVAQDGYTYEYEVIALWLLTHDTSPMTRQQMTAQLHPNHTVAQLTAQLIEQQPELLSEVHEMGCITAILRAEQLGWRPRLRKVSALDFAHSFSALTRADRAFVFEFVELTPELLPTISDSYELLVRYAERKGAGTIDTVLELLGDARMIALHHTKPDEALWTLPDSKVCYCAEVVAARLKNPWARAPAPAWPKVRSIEVARSLHPNRRELRFFTSSVRRRYQRDRRAC